MFETLGMTLERNHIEPRTEAPERDRLDRRTELARLIPEIQVGASPESFRRLFEIYCPPVTHFFLNRGFSDQESEDLAQEALLRVYRSIGTFRSESSLDTWLFKIVKNVWKNEIRRRRAQKRHADEVPLEAVIAPEESDENSYSEPQDPVQGPLDQVLAGERSRLLYLALEELPPKMHQCVLLRIGQGLKYREVAAVMKVSIATVKSQLNEAKQRLGPLLEPHSDVLS